MKVDLNPNEVVIKASDSNFYQSNSAIDGKLILTNQRLFFKADAIGAASHEVEVYPGDIQEILYFKTVFLSPNGLNVIKKDGGEFKFKVKQRNSWVEMINKMY